MTPEYPTLVSRWTSGEEFLENFTDGAPPRLFHRVPQDREPPQFRTGMLISLVVRFEDREAQFHLHALVIDRRTGTEKRGLTLEFLDGENDRVQLLLMAAKGESLPYRRRRHSRIIYELTARLEVNGKRITAKTNNITEGGVHVALETPLAEDTEINIELMFPDGTSISVHGRVAESIAGGPQRGIGVEFLFSSSDQRDSVREQVAKLRSKAPSI